MQALIPVTRVSRHSEREREREKTNRVTLKERMQRWRDKVTAGTEREWADEREDKERDEYRKRVKEEEQREKKSHLKKRRVRKPPTCPSLDTHTHTHTHTFTYHDVVSLHFRLLTGQLIALQLQTVAKQKHTILSVMTSNFFPPIECLPHTHSQHLSYPVTHKAIIYHQS